MKTSLKVLAQAMTIALSTLSFSIVAHADSASQISGKAANSTKEINLIDVAKKAKKLSGKVLFEESSALYEKSAAYQDRQIAFVYALEGAKKGNSNAQLLTSVMYEIGEGVEMDVDEAKKWRLQAAEKGNVDAKGVVALMGIAQDFDKIDIKKLKPYAEEAYKTGSIFGVATMAYIYFDGYGVEVDKVKGRKLLMQAMSKPQEEMNFFEKIYISDIQQLVLDVM